MNVLKLFFLIFTSIAIGQNRFNFEIEHLKQQKKYEYIYPFENNYAVFRTFDNKMGVIDSTGSVVIKPAFEYAYITRKLKNLIEVGKKTNKKFKRGFIDLKGNIKIPLIYDDVYYAENKVIRIIKDNKYGAIDTLNKIILHPKFDYLAFDNGLIVATLKGTKCLYDLEGKQIGNLRFSEISNFVNNKAIIKHQNKSNAIITDQGTVILKPIKGFSFERILDNDLFLIKDNKNSQVGIINLKGEFLIKCKYHELIQAKSFFIATRNNKKGFISLTDAIIKPLVYDEIYFSYFDDAFLNGKNSLSDYFIVKKDKLYGVINPNLENEIIPVCYRYIRTLFNSYFIVENNENKNGLFFTNGQKVLNEDYKFYNVFENSIFTTKNNKTFLVKLEEKKFTEIEFFVDDFVALKDEFSFSKNANQIFKLKEKFGVINNERKIIIPCDYELIENIYLSEEFIVKKNNKFGIVNADNNAIVPIEYDSFKKLKELILFTKFNQTEKTYHSIKFR